MGLFRKQGMNQKIQTAENKRDKNFLDALWASYNCCSRDEMAVWKIDKGEPQCAGNDRLSIILSFPVLNEGFYGPEGDLCIEYLFIPFNDYTGCGTIYHFLKHSVLTPFGSQEAMVLLEHPDMMGKIGCTEDGCREVIWRRTSEQKLMAHLDLYVCHPMDEPVMVMGKSDCIQKPSDIVSCCYPWDFSSKVHLIVLCDVPEKQLSLSDDTEGDRDNGNPYILDESGIQDTEILGAVRKMNRNLSVFYASGNKDGTGRLEGCLLPLARKFLAKCKELWETPSLSDDDRDLLSSMGKTLDEVADAVEKACTESRKQSAAKEMMGVLSEIEVFRSYSQIGGTGAL